MLCISWVFNISFPSAAVWDDICYFMPVHCKHAGLLNVPLLSPLLPENNRPYSSAHLLMQNLRRSETNKPLHHLLQETHTPVLLIEIYWQSCVSPSVCVSLISTWAIVSWKKWTVGWVFRAGARVRCFLKHLNGSLSFGPSASKWASCFAFFRTSCHAF